MLQRPVPPGPGRDEDPGRAEEDWLAWCEAAEDQLDLDEEEPEEDAEPWDVDLDALIAECREITAEEAALAARAARQSKVAIIARATAVLDPAEARAAEAKVLDRAGRLTPGALRAAIARAVMEVAPKKAKERREAAAKDARVERWARTHGPARTVRRLQPPAPRAGRRRAGSPDESP